MDLDVSSWEKVINALDKTVSKYETVNRIITFGYSNRMRKKLVEMIGLRDGMHVLDAGCGPGNMSLHLLKKMRRGVLYCLDPLQSMLKAAFNNLRWHAGDVKLHFIEGTFESIPLPDSSIDLVVASYSLRDARDLYKALSEFKRVLKPGGDLLVLDLVKPDNRVVSWLVGIYIHYLVPIISATIYGSLNNPWRQLYPTYREMITASELLEIIKEEFEVIRVKKAGLGAFLALRAKKP